MRNLCHTITSFLNKIIQRFTGMFKKDTKSLAQYQTKAVHIEVNDSQNTLNVFKEVKISHKFYPDIQEKHMYHILRISNGELQTFNNEI